jgi:Raf kinase inhibitor-like YbhB/YbcL family protein
MALHLESPAFSVGGPIARDQTEDGANLSPPLNWSGVPAGTVELALLVDDPDAPVAEPWVHWIVWKIPPTWTGLPGGFHGPTLPESCSALVQGQNTWGTYGYRGPAPPRGHGTHHYHFTLYSLDRALDLPVGSDKRTFLNAVKGLVRERAELVGTYERK